MTPALVEIARSFLKLGCISFGGPVAHLGYLRDEFVGRRRWLDDEDFGDLVALCQFLPGPASSQVVFALGMRRGGLPGALLASACFTLPSALLMILFAYGVAKVGDLRSAGWLHGLKLAAAAVVAQAVWTMGRTLCPDLARISIALAAAAGVLALPGAAGQIGVIALGAIAGAWIYRHKVPANPATRRTAMPPSIWAAGTLALWAALLFLLPLVATGGWRSVQIFDRFYRAGSLVFGGGHVVLPLLRAEVVTPGWMSDDRFLAGYGAAQALPGPLFTFAAYLGTLIDGGPHAWLGGLLCLMAILLPAWMLVGGALPFWHRLRNQAWSQAALRGANAAVVGLLLAALYRPIWQESVHTRGDVAAGLIAFVFLSVWRIPQWLLVAVMAAAGQWLL